MPFCWCAFRSGYSSPSPVRTNCLSPAARNLFTTSTSLHVPSIGLIVAGDVVYNQCRMYVGDTTPESRKNWIAALDRLAALNPAIVVAGHKKPGAPDSPSTIQDTKRYLQDFDRLQKNSEVRPGAVRSDDGAIPALGSQSVMVDVRIPAAISLHNGIAATG